MFRIEQWVSDEWVTVSSGRSEGRREDLMASNLASGNVYSDVDPDPAVVAALGEGCTVFRFVDEVPDEDV